MHTQPCSHTLVQALSAWLSKNEVKNQGPAMGINTSATYPDQALSLPSDIYIFSKLLLTMVSTLTASGCSSVTSLPPYAAARCLLPTALLCSTWEHRGHPHSSNGPGDHHFPPYRSWKGQKSCQKLPTNIWEGQTNYISLHSWKETFKEREKEELRAL